MEYSPIDYEEALELVRNLVIQGKKITAIKKYRSITGEGLKESKEKIDKLYETLKNIGEI